MKNAVVKLSNGGEIEVLDQALESYYAIMTNEQLSNEVRQGANVKFNQRYSKIQEEVKASLGGDPRAADLINGGIYVAQGNQFKTKGINVDAKNQGEFVQGKYVQKTDPNTGEVFREFEAGMAPPPVSEFQGTGNPLVTFPRGAINTITENPTASIIAATTGALTADQIAGRSLDGIKPNLEGQTSKWSPDNPEGIKYGKNTEFRVPEGGKGDSKFNPKNYIRRTDGGLPNLTRANYGKVAGVMPTTTPTPEELGLEGKSANNKGLKNALEAADPATKQALNIQKNYNIESPLYEQQKQGKVTGPRPSVDGNAIIASQQKQLPTTSWVRNRFKKIGAERANEAAKVRAGQPKGLSNADRPTTDVDKPKTKLPTTGKLAKAGILTPIIGGLGYNALSTQLTEMENREQYDFLRSILEENGVDTGTGQKLYTPEDVEEAMRLYEELSNAGAIKMQ